MGCGVNNCADPRSDRYWRYQLMYIVILVRRFCFSKEEDEDAYVELNRQREMNSSSF